MRRAFVAAFTAAALLAVPVATASGNSSSANNNNSQKLTKAVDLLGLTEHLTAFQLIGHFSDGNRLAGKKGHDRSAQYVYARLKLAGYKPRYQDFTYTFSGNGSLPVLSVVGGTNYAYPFQFRLPTGLDSADSGNFTRSLIAIDLNIPSTGGSTSGCETTDFPAAVAGNIALLQRGTCDFIVKFQNAINAGAVAAVIMNEGNTPDRSGFNAFNPATTGNFPVLTTTFAVGQELANGAKTGDTGRDVRVNVDIVTEELTTRNVIAETSGRANNVVVVGAHLDSVEDGPGINDNGSGSSAILEIAEEMRKVKPKNQVRFQWYSAEESGLLGSEHYVDTLPEAERRKIAAMLNFDMLASPNLCASSTTATRTPSRRRRLLRPAPAGSRRSSPTTSPRAASRRRRRSSAVVRTTDRSSPRASRPVVSSPVPKGSRPRRRRPRTAAPRASSTTRATTRTATRSRRC